LGVVPPSVSTFDVLFVYAETFERTLMRKIASDELNGGFALPYWFQPIQCRKDAT